MFMVQELSTKLRKQWQVRGAFRVGLRRSWSLV